MAEQAKITNPLALAVLALLGERPMHPYEMASTMRERGKHISIKLNYGSLYTVVDTLERYGLIVARETVREGRRPERTIYELTAAGQAKLHGWLSQLLRKPMKEYPQFMAGLSLAGALPPDEVIALLDERVRRLADSIARDRAKLMSPQVQGVPRLFLIEGEYEIAMKEADLQWTRALLADLRTGEVDGMDLWRSFHAQRGDAAREEGAM